jgi:hypothetical protein
LAAFVDGGEDVEAVGRSVPSAAALIEGQPALTRLENPTADKGIAGV